MAQQTLERILRSWTTRRDEKRRRLQLVRPWMEGVILPNREQLEADIRAFEAWQKGENH